MNPDQLNDKLEALARSVGLTRLDDLWVEFLQRKDIRVNMQKALLALSFGFYLSGKEDGSQHFYDAAGYIEGLNAKLEEDELESSPEKEGR